MEEMMESRGIEIPSIQWFPGHMAKTRRLIGANLKLVDLVLEITDARIPQSSRNPELDRWIETKPRMIVLNKCDNADPAATKRWLSYYKKIGVPALACDCKTGAGISAFLPLVKQTLAPLIQKREAQGMAGRMIRIMVVGVPNVGKSSFINRVAGAKRAKAEDRPGVTRGKQWVSLDKDVELLDMPGVLWPKFEDPLVGEKLAFTGAVKDGVVDIELLAMRLLSYLADHYPQRLAERFKMTEIDGLDGYELLELAGRKRGMLISGGEVNTERAAITVMDEYRGGKLGKLTFEEPPEE
ncbi:ribosome biogenesis GTPase YlqF [Phocea massiliensis]|uniref:Ribosome biogenesis GTPase A n=1 Tax=Merdimmobilis hominis TaxID=2897707 RepID=A0A938X7A1_9FIRM|nr:ribosome biogenesis GTPase YlqF [Merdimmobilis hominis]MBM6921496.1 ribosome biogenesis GTPase YlqF [Merdimmobilis hominis]